jgi:hypothetical protein
MQTRPQPAAALRDRAERHVFGVVATLPATERRVLALLELAGADRAAAAADTGLDDAALARAAAAARKALRRTLAPLAAGGRCEHAEQLLSDERDGAIDRSGRRWLGIHMDRCGRCREHETLLARAAEALHASFVADPAAPAPAAPAPPPAVADDRARLRVVPSAPPAPPPADEPAPTAPAAARGPDTVPHRHEAPPTAAPPPAPPRTRRALPAAAIARAARVAAVLLVIAAMAVAIALAVSSAGGGGDQRAPWSAPDAPEVHPSPLSGQ